MGKESADNYRRNWFSYSICLAVLLCLLNFVFPARLNAANTTVGVQVCNTFVGAPTLTSPSSNATTQSSSVILSGVGTPSTLIYAFRNSTQVGYVTSAGDGSYSISVALVVGANSLHTAVLDECSEYVDSSSVTITRQAVPPTDGDDNTADSGGDTSSSGDNGQSTSGGQISAGSGSKLTVEKGPSYRPLIGFPNDSDKFNRRNILVSGVANPSTRVRIYLNGLVVAEVISDDLGQFSASVYLQDGENKLFVSTGSGKNLRKSSVITVYYQPDLFTIISMRWRWVWLMILLIILTLISLIFLLFRRRQKSNINIT